MPDFSKPEGGFGAGKAATDYKFQLVVIEEWDDGAVSATLPLFRVLLFLRLASCQGAVGRNLAISTTPIIYNATSSS